MRVSRFLTVITAILLSLVATSSAAPRTESTQELSDTDISNAIRTDLLLDQSIPAHYIDVTTNDGIVTLSGSVSSILARDRAVQRALSTKGVRSVIDELEVKPTWRSDHKIRQDVIAALVNDPATDSYETGVEVDDGIVTLSGTVESWAEKKLCSDVAKSVRGVREVKSNISISYPETRSDYEIKQDIARRLAFDVLVDDGLIEIQVENGKVTLTGTVGSAAERIEARTDAWVNGVSSVDVSDLEINWWARDRMRRIERFTGRSEQDIDQAVEEALLYDPRVNSFEIDARAENGTVTLTGVVDNLQAKQSAESDAENTVGVWRVKNLIAVRTTEIYSDTDVASDIHDAMARNPFVTSSDVTVTVINGRAYLTGTVNSLFEKTQAEQVAARVAGVADVDNNLHVSFYEPLRNDWEIREDIEDELFWSPFVDSDQITVTVNDGVATLKGEVDTWSEFIAAGENAREGGARRVNNDLNFNYGPSMLERLF